MVHRSEYQQYGQVDDSHPEDVSPGDAQDIAEKETAAEILLESKGFEDVVVSITDNTVDVVVSAAELTEAERAQIEDIVIRKTGIAPENIVISTLADQ